MGNVTLTSYKTEEVIATPELMAKAFWLWDDRQQAEFFKHLHTEVTNTVGVVGLAENQWCAMKLELDKMGEDAKQMYMAVACFAFELVDLK